MPENVSGGERRPRAVALVGPYGSGKSTLFEALLAAAGQPRRPGARGRGPGTDLQLEHCSYLGDPWALLDCPGSIEFSHEVRSALAVVDLAVVVCEPALEKARMLAPLFRVLEEGGVPHLLFVNKIDMLGGRVRDTLAALQAYSSRPLVLRQVPLREDGKVVGYVDLASERAYRYREGAGSEIIDLPPGISEREKEAHFALLEALADHDDALLEKILEDVTPSAEEVYRQMHKDVVQDAIVPVLLGAGEHDNGVRRLWKALRHDTPDPTETAARKAIAEKGELLAQVFKTVHAGHAGKLSYARIWRGPVKDGAVLNGQRIGGIYRFGNGAPAKAMEAVMGEIVAFGRLEGVPSGATLSPSSGSLSRSAAALPWPVAPAPVYALAISTGDHKDDVKLSGALQKIAEEDPALRIVQIGDTGETVLQGQGEMHLNAAVERLGKLSGLRLAAVKPRVPFKETIRRPVHQHARLKRQTGGHGQFADVTIDIAPRGRGEGFAFTSKIVGGTVPKQYIPAVAEAAETAMKQGPFGQPVVDIEVVLVDGGFHSVDSSDMAFKTATRMAIQEALAKADPVLLEPIDHVTISVPSDYTPSAQRLATGRRGRILGYAERPGWPGWDDVEAQIPEAELHDLIIELRSLTMGLGTYRRSFDHLAETRGTVASLAAAG